MCDHPNGNFVHHKTPADFLSLAALPGKPALRRPAKSAAWLNSP